MLEVSQLTRQYNDFTAVDQVSFTIQKGEIVGLLGHNGAGKTTIMKMISGFLEPNQGAVTVNGINLADNPKKIQASLGYLPESLPVYPEMSVADYLDYAADLKGLRGADKIAAIKEAIQATDIRAKLASPIANLSRGFKQRVGVAQAILGHPKLLILDEPTNGLDPEQTQHMRNLIRHLAKDATIILSTHVMQEVEALCSRVLMLRAGSLVVDASLKDLTQSHHLILESSLPESDSAVITAIDGVEDISLVSQDNPIASSTYRISLQSDKDRHVISAHIAQAIIQSKAQLYRLFPEHRNLESLFREVTTETLQQEGVRHAA